MDEMLSDEKIQKLLSWFVNQSEMYKNEVQRRKKIQEENNKWIQPEVISNLSDEELKSKFNEYFNTGGGRQKLNRIYRDRIIRDMDKFRKTISFLLNEEIDIKDRIDKIKEGEYKIEGFGRAIVTSFLTDYKPEKYCLWNKKTEMGFNALGKTLYEKNEKNSVKYLKVISALQEIKDFKPELNLDFGDIDLFLHTISAEEEGVEAVEVVRKSEDLPISLNNNECELNRNMRFNLEKYLENFIEDNFQNIDFGAKLKIYDNDEESYGRQYQTDVGIIDLLAVNEEKKEFVVMELKKQNSSDKTVGQILRYIGWIRENLAKEKGYSVRGIIIAKEKDIRLEYALKPLPEVDLFLYDVSFKLKKEI